MAGQRKSAGAKGGVVLASASPRRAELLRAAGYDVRVVVSPVEEPRRRPAWVPLGLWPTALAFMKAYSVQRMLQDPRAVVIGADTIVVHGTRMLGKPRDRSHARQMLQRLSGQQHEVITGLAVLRGGDHRFTRAVSVCKVKRLSEKWLKAYLDSGLWKGKAGAYGIQDEGDPWVTLVSGEWSNVVGLPMALLGRELATMGVDGKATGV